MSRVIARGALVLGVCLAFGAGVAVSVWATQSADVFPAATMPAVLALTGAAAVLLSKVIL